MVTSVMQWLKLCESQAPLKCHTVKIRQGLKKYHSLNLAVINDMDTD